MSHSNFGIFHQFIVLLKLTCLVALFDSKFQLFQTSPKWTIFGIFDLLLSIKNINVARFARNVEWDFLWDLFSNTLDLISKI